ncbi:MAG: cation transporter [Deltaproteobacteria bacterium]|nr:cation transporter [Deltaproteobacteria bacterium]
MSPEHTGPPRAAGDRSAWFALDTDVVLQRLGSTAAGLSSAEAAARLARHGANTLPRARGDGAVELLWRQIDSPLIWVLIASGAIAMAVDPTDGVANGMVILAVVLLNTLIGFVQEWKAGRAIEALAQWVPENVAVLRDGRRQEIPVAALVPGDVVRLASGDRVPADLRLLHARNLHADEAALTGESVPAHKFVDPVAADAAVGDRCCLLFGGTLVTAGSGTAVVVETGATTELGRISQMLESATSLETPLTRALAEIGRTITIAIVVVAAAMLAVGTARAMTAVGLGFVTALRETAIFAIALAVGAIPEGLPAIVTIALAIGVQRMASRRAVVRKLPAVETLGSTTVICSDKTGTLTRNEMTVQALWTPASGVYTVSGVGYQPEGQIHRNGIPFTPLPPDVHELLLCGALCNDASITCEAGEWKIVGDPTEGALVVAAVKLGIAVEEVRQHFVRTDALPFESENQFMATLHRPAAAALGAATPHGGGSIVMKGAPEVVLARCSAAAGASLDVSAAAREVDRLAAQGMRVLAVAAGAVPHDQSSLEMEDVANGLTLLGFEGMIDPPRPEAILAVERCHAAGITVKMITGDHHETAAAIGAQLGILLRDPHALRVVTGKQLAAMSEADLQRVAVQANVFARVAPEHKLALVRALQARGEVVAMTGDGVNDAPALKQANIGVAMGITGTSVAKDAAAIVLTDDNFASIAAAVEEGRRVYDNLIKSLAFVLPTNLGLAMILMVAVAFFPFAEFERLVSGVAQPVRELLLPMLPTQILWINLVATVALALPLAFEVPERDVMERPPRSPSRPVLSRFVIVRTFIAATLMCGGAVGLFYWEYAGGLSLTGRPANGVVSAATALAEAQTMAVTTVIAFQIFYMLNCRSLRGTLASVGFFSNWTVFLGIGALVALQALFIYSPILNEIFGSAPLAPLDVLWATLVGAIILPVISIEKWDRNRRLARRNGRRGEAA